MINIRDTDPRDPRVVNLLEQSHALMLSLFPADECHFLEIDQLCSPKITFLAAYDGDQILGTGAIKDYGDYSEIKSMFTDEAARGRGIAAALLGELENRARALGHQAMKLETGDTLDAARRLYLRLGFSECPPFGDYEVNQTSVFYHKQL